MASEKGFGTPSEIIIDGRRMSREEFETHIAESECSHFRRRKNLSGSRE